jgi:hypothetical protein
MKSGQNGLKMVIIYKSHKKESDLENNQLSFKTIWLVFNNKSGISDAYLSI